MRNIGKSKIIIIICIVLAIGSFLAYFLVGKKFDSDSNKLLKEKEEIVGDISFTYVDKSIYIKDVIPTLDKFGVMNEAFSFTIKNKDFEDLVYNNNYHSYTYISLDVPKPDKSPYS